MTLGQGITRRIKHCEGRNHGDHGTEGKSFLNVPRRCSVSWVQGRTCSIQHGTSAPRPGQAPERAEHTRGMLTGKSFRAQESMCWPSGALPWATLSGFRRGACPPLDRWASGLRAWDSRPQCSCSGLPRSRQLTGLTRTDCAGWTTAWKSPACGSRIFQCVRANQGGECK